MFTRPGRTIALIFVLGLGVRLLFALTIDVVIDPGELQYNALAAQGELGAAHAPLYILFLRLVYRLFGAFNGRAVYVVQAIAGSFVTVLMHGVASRVGGQRAGLVAAIVSALYPGFILYTGAIITETWSVLLVASMMALASAATREGLRALVCGALVGVGMLLKPVYAFFLPGFLITMRRRVLLLIAGLLVVVAPLAVKSSLASGRFVPVYEAKPYGMSFDLYAYGKWRIVDVVYSNAVLLYSWHQGENVEGPPEAKTELLANYYVRKYSYLVLLWLGLIGLARCVRRKHIDIILPVLGAVIVPILFTRVTEPRFRVFLEPLLIFYVAILFGGDRPYPAGKTPGAVRSET